MWLKYAYFSPDKNELIQLATYPFKHLKKVLNTVEC